MRLATRFRCAALACAFTVAGATAQTGTAPPPRSTEQKTEQPAQPKKTKKPEKTEKKTEKENFGPPLTDPPAMEESTAEVSVLPCVTPAIASEQIIQFLDRIAARVTTGELMPWDAKEASENLGSASQMLSSDDLKGACATIAEVQQRYRL